MQEVVELFKGPTAVPALAVAIAAFILGFLSEMVLCAISRRCGGDRRQSSGQPRPRVTRPHPAPADGSIEIYVGNLNYEMTDEILRKEFEAYGKVNSARIITNRFNGKSKGFGFVHMPVMAEAEAAIKALAEKEVLGRRLKCNIARNQ